MNESIMKSNSDKADRSELIKALVSAIDPEIGRIFDEALTGTIKLELHVRQGGVGRAFSTFRKAVL